MKSKTDPSRNIEFVFFNPWERVIGPNIYLREILANLPEISTRSLVVFPEKTDAGDDYVQTGCRTEVWPEMQLVHPRPSLKNLTRLALSHSLGLVCVMRRLKKIRPVAMISNGESLLLGGLAARMLGIVHIQIFHGIAFEYRLKNRPGILRAYVKFMSLFSDYLVTVSKTQAAALQRNGVDGKKLRTVFNPIPVSELQAAAKCRPGSSIEKILASHDPVVLISGQISPIKGHDLFIETMAYVKDRYPGIGCLLAGKVLSADGTDDTHQFYNNLIARINELKMDKNVYFLGQIQDLPSVMRRVDLYVQTSRSESFCRTVAESLVCGTPVAAFDAGAIPEVAGPGVIIAPAEDIRELADVICGLLAAPEKKCLLAEKGKQHVVFYFDSRSVALKFKSTLVSAVYESNRLKPEPLLI